MNRAKISEKIRTKTFMRMFNSRHLLFTRYIVDDLKSNPSIALDAEFPTMGRAGKKKCNNLFRGQVMQLYRKGKLQNLCSKLVF